MFVKNNLVNRGYCLFQSCLNRFSLPCGGFGPKHEILHFPPRKANAKVPPRKANAKLSLRKANARPSACVAAAQPDAARPSAALLGQPLGPGSDSAAGNPHVCAICPVAVIPSLAISIRWDNPPIAKTKISASLQLFCDCELSPVPAKRKRSLHTANYLHFCASIRNWEARNNCQSQKSCNLSRFFVSGLLE